MGNLFKRRTRAAGDEGDDTLQGIVKQVLLEAMQKKKLEMNTKINEGSDETIKFPIDSSPDNPFNIPVNLLPSGHPQNHLPQHHFDLHSEPQPHLVPVDPPFLVPADPPHPTHLIPAYPPGHPAPEHPPIVTSYEIPAPPGCRSLATKTCWKIPIIVPKKVPFETCREVPDVECVTVVKNKPEIECTPEPYQDCNDVAKDIPYLEPGEECEEIFFDECREVGLVRCHNYCPFFILQIEEKVPLELCKRKRLDEESIFLTRGQVFRKEGEVRRRKIGKTEAEGKTY